MTVSALFATARGLDLRTGSRNCFYCGASCDETNAAADYVKKEALKWLMDLFA